MVLVLAFGSFLAIHCATFVAVAKEHHSTLSIFSLNLFLGWTVCGCLTAMYWAGRAFQLSEVLKQLVGIVSVFCGGFINVKREVIVSHIESNYATEF